MDITQVRALFTKRIEKDATTTRGDAVVTFVSYPALKQYIDTYLPEGVTADVRITTHHEHPINVLVGEVKHEGTVIHSEEFAMGLQHNPMDAVGLITMAKKAILMSMLGIIPDDSNPDKKEIDDDIFAAAVSEGKKHGFAKVVDRLQRKYNLSAEVTMKLKKAIETKK
jgi:hypothetical protein